MNRHQPDNHEDAETSVSRLFGVLSNPTRLKLLNLLKNHEQDVTHIQQELGISQSGVSQHLSLLKKQGLVQERREGKHVFYSLKSQKLSQVLSGALQLVAVDLASETELIQAFTELLTLWTI